MEKVKNKPKPRIRDKSKIERKAVPGLCLFCHNYYPRDWKLITNRIISFSNSPKHKRCFKFLTSRLNIKEPKPSIRQPEGGFNFISEIVPLCPSCFVIFDQVHSLYLKAQSVKYRLDKCVEKIRKLIVDSGTKEAETKLLNNVYEDESHFSYFRRQVQPLGQEVEGEGQGQGSDSLPTNPRKEYDLVITKPEVKLIHLTTEEINKYKRKPPPPPIEESDFLFMDFDFGDDDITQEEHDVKPEVAEIAELNLQLLQSSPIDVLPQTPHSQEDNLVVPVLPVEDDVLISNTDDVDVVSNIQIVSVASQPLENLDTPPHESNSNQDGATEHPDNPEMPPPNLEDSSENPSTKRRRKVFPKSEGQNDCKLCPLSIRSQDKLIAHYKSVHPGKFPSKCDYPDCPFECFPRCDLRKHVRVRHGPDEEREKMKTKQCPECGKRFDDRKGLDYHIRTHTGEKPFKCEECGKSFRQKQAVETHMFRIHLDIRNFECPHCPWKFKDKTSLNDHIAIHTGEKNFVCHICGTKRIQHFALKKHFKVHKKRGDWVDPPEGVRRRRFWRVKKKGQETQRVENDGKDPGPLEMDQDSQSQCS